MKSATAFVIFCVCLGALADDKPQAISTFHGKETLTERPDVYWKTWKGKAPRDAVVIDETMCEAGVVVPVYLGQTYITVEKGSLQPVSLLSRSISVKPTYAAKIHETDRHVEVLCAEDRDIFTWVPVNETKNFKADEDCFVSGAELDFNLYFGRTEFEGHTVYGKVLLHRTVMFFPYKDKERELTSFEVLCYRDAVERRNLESLEKTLKSDKKEDTQEPEVIQGIPKDVGLRPGAPRVPFRIRF